MWIMPESGRGQRPSSMIGKSSGDKGDASFLSPLLFILIHGQVIRDVL
jgi:hypothetical protein